MTVVGISFETSFDIPICIRDMIKGFEAHAQLVIMSVCSQQMDDFDRHKNGAW